MLGSSRSSSFGCAIIARATASICCSPPESVPATWFSLSLRMGKREYISSRVRAVSVLSFRVNAPNVRFSFTLSS